MSSIYVIDKVKKMMTLSNSMFFCILMYCLFKQSFRDFTDVFQTIIVVSSFIVFFIKRNVFFKDEMFILLFISLIAPIFSWVNSIYFIPDNALSYPKIGVVSNLFFFVMMAYWLRGDFMKIRLALFALVIGIIFTAIFYSHNILIDIIRGFQGKRVDFDYYNANHIAALSGSGLIISTYYLFENKFTFKFKFILCFFLTSMLLFIFIVSKSRAAWLALIVSSIVSIIITHKGSYKTICKLLFFLVSLFFVYLM